MQAIILLIQGKLLMDRQKRIEIQIPDETIHEASQIFSINNPYLMVGDNLNQIIDDINLQLLNPSLDSDFQATFRLSLITAFQYIEALSDRQALEAIRKRIDWKYALFLPINHPGISGNSLCDFRQSLCFSSKALEEFGNLLEILGDFGFFTASSSPWLNPKETLLMICQTNRVFNVVRGMKSALGLVVSIAPEWVKGQVSPHWYQRYKTGPLRRQDISQIPDFQTYANQIGSDIFALLTALNKGDAPDLSTKAEIRHLTRLFQEYYFQNGDIIQWRAPGCANCVCNNQFF